MTATSMFLHVWCALRRMHDLWLLHVPMRACIGQSVQLPSLARLCEIGRYWAATQDDSSVVQSLVVAMCTQAARRILRCTGGDAPGVHKVDLGRIARETILRVALGVRLALAEVGRHTRLAASPPTKAGGSGGVVEMWDPFESVAHTRASAAARARQDPFSLVAGPIGSSRRRKAP